MSETSAGAVVTKLLARLSGERDGSPHECYAPQTHVVHPFMPGTPAPLTSREALAAHFARGTEARRAMELRAVNIRLHETADPEVVVAEFDYQGRSRRTGEPFSLPCIFVVRVRDGLIVESRDYVDHARLGEL